MSLTNTLDKLPPLRKKRINEIFLNAALAFELSPKENFRFYLKIEAQKSVGAAKRMALTLAALPRKEFSRAIDVFFEEIY